MAVQGEAGPEKGREPGPKGGAGLLPLDWSRRIEEALDKGLFVLHAQRIVDVASGETVRHELFLRMVDKRRLIPAGEFVVAAEEFGSIRDIDHWVVSRAIELAAAGRPIDLNLSVRSTDDALLELISTKLDETSADPGDLVFEVSEEQLEPQAETRGEFVRALDELGCRIALDGFIEGGRRSFLIRDLPISFIKLGGRFIKNLDTRRGTRRAATGAAQKAHRFGQRVIAQGVENLATLELLEGLGIDEAQGYALGPPESLEAMLGASA